MADEPATREGFLARLKANGASKPVQTAGYTDLFIRRLTARQVDAFNAATSKAGATDPDSYRARLLAATICDANGRALLSEADVAAIQDGFNPAVEALAREAAEHNALGGYAQDAAELEKNSLAAR